MTFSQDQIEMDAARGTKQVENLSSVTCESDIYHLKTPAPLLTVAYLFW